MSAFGARLTILVSCHEFCLFYLMLMVYFDLVSCYADGEGIP